MAKPAYVKPAHPKKESAPLFDRNAPAKTPAETTEEPAKAQETNTTVEEVKEEVKVEEKQP